MARSGWQLYIRIKDATDPRILLFSVPIVPPPPRIPPQGDSGCERSRDRRCHPRERPLKTRKYLYFPQQNQLP
jgi:hypothetical protein